MSRSRNFRARASAVGMSRSASAPGFQLRMVSFTSITTTAAGSASSARWTRADGAAASARACGADPVSDSPAAAGREAVEVRLKMRHFWCTGVNRRDRDRNEYEAPGQWYPSTMHEYWNGGE